MTLAFAPPPCPDSPLARLDPRWKLAGLGLLLLATVLLGSVAGAGLALTLALALALLARVPAGWLGPRVGWAALLLCLFALPLPFLVAAPAPLFRWGWLSFDLK